MWIQTITKQCRKLTLVAVDYTFCVNKAFIFVSASPCGHDVNAEAFYDASDSVWFIFTFPALF